MAKHLQRDSEGGHLLRRGEAVDHLANECAAVSCRDLTCPDSDVATVSVAGVAADCECVADDYTIYQAGWAWGGVGGWCEDPDTDFSLDLICQDDGTWLIQIISYVGGYTYFEGTATTAEISCGGGAFTGSATIDGVDNSGGGGPDCSGCTATVTF